MLHDSQGRLPDRLVRILSQLHAGAFRLTGGRLGRRLVNNDMLVLTTIGRRSGRPHTVPLLYLRDGSDLVVFASYGGRDRHPEWYLNLVEHPRVEVRIGRTPTAATAAPARGARREELWNRAVAAYDGYLAYQERTHRRIPVIVLSVD